MTFRPRHVGDYPRRKREHDEPDLRGFHAWIVNDSPDVIRCPKCGVDIEPGQTHRP